MDAIGIRATARLARRAACARLGDAAPAHEVLMATLADLGIKHVLTPEGSVLAPNVAGRLYRRGKVIRVATRLTPADRTFVGAHELGHYLLHPGEHLELTPTSTKLGQPWSPHGTFEAIGYSERERIEAEADTFAAEFTCPSDWLRDQILRHGRKPTEIAAASGLSPTLVTAQAIHAVLLPPHESLAPRSRQTFDPTPAQVAAAAWPGRAILLEGSAGTGKTEAAARRIAWLAAGETTQGGILALSSSSATAEDLRARVGDPAALARSWIGTAAEFGFEVIAKNTTNLGLTDRFRLLDETGALALFSTCLPAASRQKAMDALRTVFRAKERLVTARDWKDAADRQAAAARGRDAKTAAAEIQRLGDAYALYELALAKADAIDAADLAAMPIRLLGADSEALAGLRRRFRHIVIDDLQDAGPATFKLIEALSGPDTTLWATGDAAQCVMGFRGADPATLPRFADRFGAERRSLDRNHRAEPRAARHAASVMRRLGAPASSPRSANAVATSLRDSVETCRSKRIGYGEQVILCRTHATLKRVVASVERLGVPVAMTPDLSQEAAVEDLLAVAHLVAEGAAEAFAHVARLPEYDMSARDASAATAWARTRRGPLPRSVTRRGAEALQRLAADLEGLDASTPACVVMTTWLFERSGYLARRIAEGEAARRSLAAMHHLIRVAEEHAAQGDADHGRLVARVRRAGSINQDTAYKRASAADGRAAVRAMTVHAARGLEFDAVHLVGMTRDKAASTRRETHGTPRGLALELADADRDHGEAAALVVAVTRARKWVSAF